MILDVEIRDSDAPLLVACVANALRPRAPPLDWPTARWSIEATATGLRVEGELDAAGWERLADELGALALEGLGSDVELDLRELTHARPVPARTASHLRALERAGVALRVRASAYVRACIEASRWGCELRLAWEVA